MVKPINGDITKEEADTAIKGMIIGIIPGMVGFITTGTQQGMKETHWY